MTTHTPGPWKRRDGQPFTIAAPADIHIRPGEHRHFDDAHTIATVAVNQYGRGRDESEANARLIAAAPKLLAALKDALAEISPDSIGGAIDILESFGRVAVAEAEGPS